MNYTITLTETENKALGYVAMNQQDWMDNAAHERCRIAIDEIAALTVQKCLESNIQIPSSKDDMVTLAFEQGWVKTAFQRNEEAASERVIEPMVMMEA